MSQGNLSDKALSILAFAAYHSLVSGEEVKEVVLDDGQGHHADSEGVKEMEAAGFLTPDGPRGALTDKGSEALGRVMNAIRGNA